MTDTNNTCEHVKKKGRNKRGYCWPCLAAKMRDTAVEAVKEKALLKKELADMKKELARVHARESEAVMQSARDAARADANASEVSRLTQKLKTCRNDALEEAAKRLEWAMPRTIHKETMVGACHIIRAIKEK